MIHGCRWEILVRAAKEYVKLELDHIKKRSAASSSNSADDPWSVLSLVVRRIPQEEAGWPLVPCVESVVIDLMVRYEESPSLGPMAVLDVLLKVWI